MKKYMRFLHVEFHHKSGKLTGRHDEHKSASKYLRTGESSAFARTGIPKRSKGSSISWIRIQTSLLHTIAANCRSMGLARECRKLVSRWYKDADSTYTRGSKSGMIFKVRLGFTPWRRSRTHVLIATTSRWRLRPNLSVNWVFSSVSPIKPRVG